MKLSKNGLNFIKEREEFRSVPYRDIGGKWTIGYGHLIKHDEHFDEISEHEGEVLLLSDVAIAEKAVNSYVTVPIDQNEYDALVSLIFNIGVSAFKTSALLKKLNAGDYSGAAEQFLVWNKYTDKSGKKRSSDGLMNRRKLEKELFCRELDKKPLTKSKTMAGLTVTTTSAGALEVVNDLSNQVQSAQFLGLDLWVFKALAVALFFAGAGLTVYGYLHTRKDKRELCQAGD